MAFEKQCQKHTGFQKAPDPELVSPVRAFYAILIHSTGFIRILFDVDHF